jgi:hypothetical protein
MKPRAFVTEAIGEFSWLAFAPTLANWWTTVFRMQVCTFLRMAMSNSADAPMVERLQSATRHTA